MSIQDELRFRIEEGRLFLVNPLIHGSPHPRLIYATSEIWNKLCGPWSDKSEEYRMNKLYADLDHFSSGERIIVSRGNIEQGYMKPLDDISEEVWEIRSRDPKPSLRLFGRFAETDIFIATNLRERIELGSPGSKPWRDEFERCKAEWRKLFPAYEPLTGSTLRDYISENVVDLTALK